MPIARWFSRWFTPKWAAATPIVKAGLVALVAFGGIFYFFVGPVIYDAGYWVLGRIVRTASDRRLRTGLSVAFAVVYLVAISISGSAAKKPNATATSDPIAAVASSTLGATPTATAASTVTSPTATPATTPTSVPTVTPAPTPTMGPTPTPTATPKPTPTPTPEPTFVTFDDGTYAVGTDIKAGTYRTREASPTCYWERLKGFDGTLSEILANELTDGPSVVRILATDKGFTTRGCGTWTTDLSTIINPGDPIDGTGLYIVGTDIKAGTYRAPASAGCYWARLKGFTGGMGDIIANDLTDASTVVTIRSTDKGFKTAGCGTWTKR